MHRNLGAQLSFSLSLLIHPLSPPLVSTSLFICLPGPCLSLALFLSFLPARLRCCFSVFLKHTQHFSLCFCLTLILSPSLCFCTLFPLMPSLLHTSSLPHLLLPLSIPVSSCSLHVSLHHHLPAVLLLPRLVACWRGLLHWVGWNLTWQVPWLWQEGKCILEVYIQKWHSLISFDIGLKVRDVLFIINISDLKVTRTQNGWEHPASSGTSHISSFISCQISHFMCRIMKAITRWDKKRMTAYVKRNQI